MKTLNLFLTALLLSMASFSNAANLTYITAVDGYTAIKPYYNYPVTINYTFDQSQTGYPTFLVTLKNPSANWATYASKIVVDSGKDGWEKAYIDANAPIDCACVWEVRAIESVNNPYGAYSSMMSKNVQVYLEDDIISAKLPGTQILAGQGLPVTIKYIAKTPRDLTVELITGNSTTYSQARVNVAKGAGELTLTLPVSSQLPQGATPYVSVKILPTGGTWSQYLDQENYNVTVTRTSYYWNFPISEFASFDWNSGNPNANSFMGKVGLLNERAYATSPNLPSAGQQGIYTETYSAYGYTAHVMNLLTGQIMVINRSRVSPGGAWNGEPTVQTTSYVSGGNNTTYRQLVTVMITNLQTVVDRTVGQDAAKADANKAITYLGFVKTNAY